MVTYLNYNINVSNTFQSLKKSDVVILPGVGAFPYAMEKINSEEIKKLSDLDLKKNYSWNMFRDAINDRRKF